MGVRPVADFRCECEFEGAPEMEKVRIGMTDSTFFICREVTSHFGHVPFVERLVEGFWTVSKGVHRSPRPGRGLGLRRTRSFRRKGSGARYVSIDL